MDFQNRSKFGFLETWSKASGDVWDGYGWCKSCLYWSPLMFGSVWDSLLVIWDNFPLTHLPPASQQTLSPFLQIMIGFESLIPYHSLIFQLRELLLRLNTASPYTNSGSEPQKLRGKLPIDLRAGSGSFDQVRNRSKFGLSSTWSEASGDVWGGQGWYKSCSCWSPLMFGSFWDCLLLIWNHFAKAHLPPTSQQTISPFPEIMLGKIQRTP